MQTIKCSHGLNHLIKINNWPTSTHLRELPPLPLPWRIIPAPGLRRLGVLPFLPPTVPHVRVSAPLRPSGFRLLELLRSDLFLISLGERLVRGQVGIVVPSVGSGARRRGEFLTSLRGVGSTLVALEEIVLGPQGLEQTIDKSFGF